MELTDIATIDGHTRRNAYWLGLRFIDFVINLRALSNPENKSTPAAEKKEILSKSIDILSELLNFFDYSLELVVPIASDAMAEYADKLRDDGCDKMSLRLSVTHGEELCKFLVFGRTAGIFHALSGPSELHETLIEQGMAAGVSHSKIVAYAQNPTVAGVIDLGEAVKQSTGARGSVFIVHGHNHEVRDKIDLFHRDLELQTKVMDAKLTSE